jgi:hypothetical protein
MKHALFLLLAFSANAQPVTNSFDMKLMLIAAVSSVMGHGGQSQKPAPFCHFVKLRNGLMAHTLGCRESVDA